MKSEFDVFLEEQMKDEEFRAEFDALRPEYEIREQILKARIEKNLTQKQTKEATGLTQQVISRIESNTDISPSLKNLMIYANALDYELTLQPKQAASSSQ